ncbi:DUF3225 domain-containing protein, partial [Nostoc sp. HG1]|nr:DUF3225 domain-containing protein [Nostoc sp. HG1]
MTTINDPAVVTEVTDLYLKYEEALGDNNLEVMDSLFWDAPEVCGWHHRKPHMDG